MHSYREPEISRQSQRDAHRQRVEHDRDTADPRLARIAHVPVPKQCREQKSGRPKTNSSGQRELRITAEQEFLEKSNKEKRDSPQCGVLNGFSTGQSETTERRISSQEEYGDRSSLRQKTPDHPFEKPASKGTAQRQTVVRERT